jgi:DNA-binding NtrC family response regulator
MESALFGHERGAFTGATTLHKGFFEQAHGGTLLLDELGDLDIALQAKLLRAIERQEVRRVGGDRWLKVNARVMAATRRDLEKEIQAGRFRDDLFYRLAVARIELPALRDRRGDIATLAQFFWGQLGGGQTPIPHDFLLRLEAYAFPGNVRELRNTIARRLALGDLAGDPGVGAPSLHEREAEAEAEGEAAAPPGEGDIIDRVVALGLPLSDSRAMVVEDFERRYIQDMLGRHGGDASRAAAAAGVARRYFQLLRSKRT